MTAQRLRAVFLASPERQGGAVHARTCQSAMTLDLDGHLVGDELDAIADRLDAARADMVLTERRQTTGLNS